MRQLTVVNARRREEIATFSRALADPSFHDDPLAALRAETMRHIELQQQQQFDVDMS